MNPNFTLCGKARCQLATVLFVALSIFLMDQSAAAEPDPFHGGTWYSTKDTWPGTISFDRKNHRVVLNPFGAQAILATYTFELKQVGISNAGKDKFSGKEGTLLMVNNTGQKSFSEFRIENAKTLTLHYPARKANEHYQRLTPAEADVYMKEGLERARKLLKQH